jgi:hypothetical protein
MSDTEIFDALCGDCMGIETVTDSDIRLSADACNNNPRNANDPDFEPYDEDDIRAAMRGRDKYYPS